MTRSRQKPDQSLLIRPISRTRPAEIDLVAVRMLETLEEVLGEEVGGSMYSLSWIRDRAQWHLDPSRCDGEIFVAEVPEGRIVGHTIVRRERDEGGPPFGLFSTIYVEPGHRRSGCATELVRVGEAWMTRRGLTVFATNTSDTNAPLIRLFEGRGYSIVYRDPEKRMVRLAREEVGGQLDQR